MIVLSNKTKDDMLSEINMNAALSALYSGGTNGGPVNMGLKTKKIRFISNYGFFLKLTAKYFPFFSLKFKPSTIVSRA